MPAHPGVLARLGAAVGARPWIALVAWALVLGIAVATALVGVTGDSLFDRLKSAAPTANGESTSGDDLLSGTGAKSQSITLLVHGVSAGDPALASAGAALAATLADVDNTTFLDPLVIPAEARPPQVSALFSADDRGVLFSARVSGVDGAEPAQDTVDTVVSDLQATRDDLRAQFPGATVEVGSSTLLVDSIVAVSESDLRRGETVALPIALVVMLVVFGGFLAAGIPLLGAIVAILGALGALFGFTQLMDIDTTVVNVVTAVGLGLSIDYGLLIVSRFREEYRAALGAAGFDAGWLGAVGGAEPDAGVRRGIRLAAIAKTADTAGRTVLYSGTTFAIASAGLLVFEPRMVRAIGLGALAVTVIAIASALTLVPALLSIAGERLIKPGLITRLPLVGRPISRFGDVAPTEGYFSRLTRQVQRRPALVTIAATLALLALGTPVLGMRLANTSIDALPKSSTEYTFIETLNTQFPEAASPRVALVTENEADAKAWAAQVERLDGVLSVSIPVQVGQGWRSVAQVNPADGLAMVSDIRADRPAFPNWVTGSDARTLDFSQSLLDRAPLALLVVALGTIVLMFLMTGSLVVPLKALVAGALSLGASIGVLVWGFQQGHLAQLMNFDASHVHGVDVLVLLLTLAFGFGLAMDYEMFIISRIKEAVDAGVPGRETIARGLQRSGRIITSAGLIIVVVFTGFATGDLMVIKGLGFALAVAVLLDATLVRLLLVPAFMTWQLRIMWWAPRWAKRLHARFGLRES
ncbi:MAG: MMPL family transporter [Pseudolysinimonas sp.]